MVETTAAGPFGYRYGETGWRHAKLGHQAFQTEGMLRSVGMCRAQP